MPLDPLVKAFLDRAAQIPRPKTWEVPPAVARQSFAGLMQLTGPKDVAVGKVENFTIPGPGGDMRARSYAPIAAVGPLSTLIYFHGGGFVAGSPESHRGLVAKLVEASGVSAFALRYRLAPENPFPAAVHDADAVLQWTLSHAEELGGDSSRLVVAGDSAGGNLATIAARHARSDHVQPVVFEVLFYPSVDISSLNYESYREFGTDHLLTKRAVEKFREFYLPNSADWPHPDASPLLAHDLSGMPATLLIGAGCDPLRDEGAAYAEKLRTHGNRVTYRLEEQMPHGFLNLYAFEPACSPYAEAVIGYAAGVIREAVRA